MKRSLITFAIIFSVFQVVYAADWKSLHEKADTLSLLQAQGAVTRSPDSFPERYMLGLVYLNMYNSDASYNTFLRLYTGFPGNFMAKWGLAESLRRKHALNRSQELLEEIIKDEPGFSPAYLSLGYVKYLKGDFESAVRLALKVIKQDPGAVDLSNRVRAYCLYAGGKGLIAHYGGMLSKAINGTAVKHNLDKAEKLQPNSTQVLFGLGSYYLLAPVIAGGNKHKAEIYLKKAVVLEPRFADVYVRLAQLYKIRKDSAKYKHYLKVALDLDPGNELALDTQSNTCKFICTGGKE